MGSLVSPDWRRCVGDRPIASERSSHNLFHGWQSLRYSYVDWYWYNIFSVAVTSGLAIGIAIPRKSIVKLILFVLFSTTGTTLFIAAFEFESPILITYARSAIIALGVSALVYYRSMIVELCR